MNQSWESLQMDPSYIQLVGGWRQFMGLEESGDVMTKFANLYGSWGGLIEKDIDELYLTPAGLHILEDNWSWRMEHPEFQPLIMKLQYNGWDVNALSEDEQGLYENFLIMPQI